MKQKKRSEIALQDTWDLTSIYKNIDEFNLDYNYLEKNMIKLSKYKNHLLDNAKTLLDFLKLLDSLERKLLKLHYYAHLNFDVDTTNSFKKELVGKVSFLMTKFQELIAFYSPEMLKGDYSLIEKFYKDEVGLKKYEFNFKNLYRYKEHTLSYDEEKILSSLSLALSSASNIYESLTDSDLTFGFIKIDSTKEEFTESKYSTYIESSDRNLRKRAFNILYKTYSNFINTFADTFRFNIETETKISKLRKYNSCIENSLYADNIDLSIYNNLINTVNDKLNVLYDYYDLKKEVLGLSKLHLYDVYANMVENVSKQYTFKEAKEIVLDSLSILGDDYKKKLNRAFDERFIDIYNNKGKRSGAYSSGFYDTNPYILLNFEGSYNDITTLAHELGHSMHTLYSCESNPYNTSSYSIFVAEVASTVNELLLLKNLIKKTDSKEEKLYLLNRLLELFKGTIFRQTMFAEFERDMYFDHENGVILTSDYICDKYYKLVEKYFDPNVICDDLIKYEWARIPHFYYNFYVYKYAIGLSAACKIVSDIENKGQEAIDKYIKFLKTGGSMYPKDELLVCDVSISSPNFILSAIDMFKDTIKEFRETYRK